MPFDGRWLVDVDVIVVVVVAGENLGLAWGGDDAELGVIQCNMLSALLKGKQREASCERNVMIKSALTFKRRRKAGRYSAEWLAAAAMETMLMKPTQQAAINQARRQSEASSGDG